MVLKAKSYSVQLSLSFPFIYFFQLPKQNSLNDIKISYCSYILYNLYYISIEKISSKDFAFKKIKERWVRVLDVCVMKNSSNTVLLDIMI